MNIDEIIFEKQRRQCWIDAYCAVASAWNSESSEVAVKWADKSLKAFDERFNKEKK